MLIAIDGGGGSAPASAATPVSTPPPPPAPPPPPPVRACMVDTVQRAPQQHRSFFDSLVHTVKNDASSAWHKAGQELAPVAHVAEGAYDVLLKPDVDGVLQHQQTAKDILSVLGGSTVSTAIGTAQNYFGSHSADRGDLMKAFTDSATENNPAAAAQRIAAHPGAALGTGYHMAMLASWLVPGAGEAADAGAHVAIAGARSLAEHVGGNAVRDAISKGAAALSKHVAEPVGQALGEAGKRLFPGALRPLPEAARTTLAHAGSALAAGSRNAVARAEKLFATDGAHAVTQGERVAETHAAAEALPSKLRQVEVRTRAEFRELSKAPAPNTAYHFDGLTYVTDERGRAISSEGTLRLSGGNRFHDDYKIGHRGEPGDIGFHGGADEFGFQGGVLNVSPGNAKLNQIEYRALERELEGYLKAGHTVEAKFERVFAPGNTSLRPDQYLVEFRVDGGRPQIQAFFNREGG